MVDERLSVWAYEGRAPTYDLTAAHGYSQEWLEGPYRADMRLLSGDGFTDDEIRQFYEVLFMRPVAALFEGVPVWTGYITGIEMRYNGVLRVKSLDTMVNAIKVKYRNTDPHHGDDTVRDWYTIWQTNEASIRDYGRIEKVVDFNGKAADIIEDDNYRVLQTLPFYVRDNTAYQYGRSYLARYSSPGSQVAIPVKMRSGEGNSIRLTVEGAMVLADKTFLSAGLLPDTAYATHLNDRLDEELRPSAIFKDAEETPYLLGDEITVSREIQRILSVVNLSSDWIRARTIEANDMPTAAGVSSIQGAMTRLLELAGLPNLDGDYYQLTVDLNGDVDYRKMRYSAEYEHTAEGGLKVAGGDEAPSWDARPGWIRYIDGGGATANTWAPRDDLAYAERTTMRDGQDVAEFHGRNIDIGDITRAIAANRRWTKRITERRKR